METLKFKAIVTGPVEYLKEKVRIEDFEITEENVLGAIEDGESSEDAIAYLKEEYCSEWEQRWCSVQLIEYELYEMIKNSPESNK